MVTVAWLNFWSCCFSSGFKCSSERSFYLMWLFSTVFSTTDLRCLKASETTERLRDEQIIKLPWDSHAFLIYVWCVTAAIGLIAQKKGRFGLRSLSFHFFFWHANPQGRSKSSSDLVSRVCAQQSSFANQLPRPCSVYVSCRYTVFCLSFASAPSTLWSCFQSFSPFDAKRKAVRALWYWQLPLL